MTEESTAYDSLSNPNRARDHLANERAYLAWIRTAIALMGFGVVIVRLRYLLPAQEQGQGYGWQLELVFALVGIFMAVMANAHYFHVKRAVDQDNYQPESRWITLCTASIVLIGAGVIYCLLTNPSFLDATP